jgi:hypothetical protein
MKRYFILGNHDTLEVCLTLPMETQPENSLPFEVVNFIKPCFDQYPNPTKLVEGATEEEVKEWERLQIPQEITRRQFKIALAVLGKNEQDILSGIDQLPEPQRTIARISYTEAGTFERYNPELIAVATMFLQMNEDDIDEVFKIGSQY